MFRTQYDTEIVLCSKIALCIHRSAILAAVHRKRCCGQTRQRASGRLHLLREGGADLMLCRQSQAP